MKTENTNKTCKECEFGIVKLDGYDYTIEEETFYCMKTFRELSSLERYGPYRAFLEYGQDCDYFSSGDNIVIDTTESFDDVFHSLPEDRKEYFRSFMDS